MLFSNLYSFEEVINWRADYETLKRESATLSPPAYLIAHFWHCSRIKLNSFRLRIFPVEFVVNFNPSWNFVSIKDEPQYFYGTAAVWLGGGERSIRKNFISQPDEWCNEVGQTNIVNNCATFSSDTWTCWFTFCMLFRTEPPMPYDSLSYVSKRVPSVFESDVFIFRHHNLIHRVNRKRPLHCLMRVYQKVGHPNWRPTTECSSLITLIKRHHGSIRGRVARRKIPR